MYRRCSSRHWHWLHVDEWPEGGHLCGRILAQQGTVLLGIQWDDLRPRWLQAGLYIIIIITVYVMMSTERKWLLRNGVILVDACICSGTGGVAPTLALEASSSATWCTYSGPWYLPASLSGSCVCLLHMLADLASPRYFIATLCMQRRVDITCWL